MTDFVVVIPARYGSSRLPGKPLLDIGGKPMVIHVAERAYESGAAEVWIATDHEEIKNVVSDFGFQACMTQSKHASGTERIAEVVRQRRFAKDRIIVNVQGDEPLIDPKLIYAVAKHLHEKSDIAISTAGYPLHELHLVFNPNVVKVVLDKHGHALYFSRAPIPYARDAYMRGESTLPEGLTVIRHIGLYAYRTAFVKTYAKLEPAPAERFEMLEQLRALWHGYKIGVALTTHAPHPGIDTPEDLEAIRQLFESTQDPAKRL